MRDTGAITATVSAAPQGLQTPILSTTTQKGQVSRIHAATPRAGLGVKGIHATIAAAAEATVPFCVALLADRI